jgi:MYXO-CTERM domain-containing protein
VTLTTFDCNSGQIFDADVLLNGANFHFTLDPSTTGNTAADVQNTVTHEAGHFIGFDHNPDPESTMYADAPLGETKKRDLTADDIQGMCNVYPGDGKGNPAPNSPAALANGCGCSAGSGAGGFAILLAVAALLWLRRRALTARSFS